MKKFFRSMFFGMFIVRCFVVFMLIAGVKSFF